ncbi:hypothetical protein JL722_14961 [Aureococcus anophagefferens]|nr:hypothetical protein JL722_14961 [Aureococcus anophagefferens]
MAPLQMGHRSRFDDAELASTIFERLRPYCPAVHLRRRLLGLTPTFRFIKCGRARPCRRTRHAGGDKHTPVGDPNCSLFTCLLYLNDGYEGCETCLLPSPGSAPPPTPLDDGWRACEALGVAVPPRAGRVLVFEHDILHACPPLRAGEKLVAPAGLFARARRARGRGHGASAGIGAALAEALAVDLGMVVVAAGALEKLEVASAAAPRRRRAARRRRRLRRGDGRRGAARRRGLRRRPAAAPREQRGLADGRDARWRRRRAIAATFGVNALAPATWTRAYLAALEAAEAPAGHVLHAELHVRATAEPRTSASTRRPRSRSAPPTRRAPSRAAKRPYPSPASRRASSRRTSSPKGPHAAGLVYAARHAGRADVVDAALFLLTAPPHVEVADLITRPRGGGA